MPCVVKNVNENKLLDQYDCGRSEMYFTFEFCIHEVLLILLEYHWIIQIIFSIGCEKLLSCN